MTWLMSDSSASDIHDPNYRMKYRKLYSRSGKLLHSVELIFGRRDRVFVEDRNLILLKLKLQRMLPLVIKTHCH